VAIMTRKVQLSKPDLPEAPPISAVTVWSLPLPVLLTRAGIGLEEAPREDLPASLSGHFCGLLVHDAHGVPVILVPTDQDTREREQRVRKLIWRHLNETPGAHDDPATWPSCPHQAVTARVERDATAEITTHPDRPTVAVSVWGGGTITIPEPAWCNGTHRGSEHPEDISHASDETTVHVTLPGGESQRLLTGWLLQYPYSRTGSEALAAIELPTGDIADYDAAGLEQLAEELRAAAAFLENLRTQLHAAQQDGRS